MSAITATTTPVVLDTRIRNAEPYKGDDWAQSLSKSMATPLFAMGLMAVLAALGTGIAGGVNTGRFFATLTHSDLAKLGRSQVLAQWTRALTFLGMGFILGGVVMHLVNIVRTLRDAGCDVQKSLGAQTLKLRKPWTGHLTPHVMLMGVMAEIGAFVAGLVAVGYIGGVPIGRLAGARRQPVHWYASYLKRSKPGLQDHSCSAEWNQGGAYKPGLLWLKSICLQHSPLHHCRDDVGHPHHGQISTQAPSLAAPERHPLGGVGPSLQEPFRTEGAHSNVCLGCRSRAQRARAVKVAAVAVP
jgi:hypothetical protein